MGDEGAKTAGLEPDRRAVLRVRAEPAQDPLRPPGAARADLLVGYQRHGPVNPDLQHILAIGYGGVDLAVAQPGAVAADAGADRLAGLRMASHRPG